MRITIFSHSIIIFFILHLSAHASGGPDSREYRVVIEKNRVSVCPMISYPGSEYDSYNCPKRQDLLRQNVDTGEVVRLYTFCGEPLYNSGLALKGACYIDECVPPGRYRYGFEKPYTCPETLSTWYHVDFYGETRSKTPLGTCTRSQGNKAPEPFKGTLPWKDSQFRCEKSPACLCSSASSADFSLTWLGLLLFFGYINRKRSHHGTRSE